MVTATDGRRRRCLYGVQAAFRQLRFTMPRMHTCMFGGLVNRDPKRFPQVASGLTGLPEMLLGRFEALRGG